MTPEQPQPATPLAGPAVGPPLAGPSQIAPPQPQNYQLVPVATPQSKFDSPNMIPAVSYMANAMVTSGLCGVTSTGQAQVLAMTSWITGVPIVELAHRNHIINGKLSKKPEVMLADFNKAGGKHRWLKDGVDKREARIALTWDGATTEVSFTIEMAHEQGLIPDPSDKKYANNQWVRMCPQMLRARVISTAIRMVAPQFCDSLYTPEEIADQSGGNVIETTLVSAPVTTPAPPSSTPLPQQQSPVQSQQPATQAQLQPQPQSQQQADEVIDVPFETVVEETFRPITLRDKLSRAIDQLNIENGQSYTMDQLFEAMIRKGVVKNPLSSCTEDDLSKALTAINSRLKTPVSFDQGN